MTVAAARQPGAGFMSPALVGVGALLVALLIVELLIQLNFISRFIVPPPSEIVR
jgi:ABC-type nitrate/sulfonate/bicarbonate transport system permease component